MLFALITFFLTKQKEFFFMGGFFGVISKEDCVNDLFYGTDYHSHLGTKRGGLVVQNSNGMKRFIHDITTAPFRPKQPHFVQNLKMIL